MLSASSEAFRRQRASVTSLDAAAQTAALGGAARRAAAWLAEQTLSPTPLLPVCLLTAADLEREADLAKIAAHELAVEHGLTSLDVSQERDPVAAALRLAAQSHDCSPADWQLKHLDAARAPLAVADACLQRTCSQGLVAVCSVAACGPVLLRFLRRLRDRSTATAVALCPSSDPLAADVADAAAPLPRGLLIVGNRLHCQSTVFDPAKNPEALRCVTTQVSVESADSSGNLDFNLAAAAELCAAADPWTLTSSLPPLQRLRVLEAAGVLTVESVPVVLKPPGAETPAGFAGKAFAAGEGFAGEGFAGVPVTADENLGPSLEAVYRKAASPAEAARKACVNWLTRFLRRLSNGKALSELEATDERFLQAIVATARLRKESKTALLRVITGAADNAREMQKAMAALSVAAGEFAEKSEDMRFAQRILKLSSGRILRGPLLAMPPENRRRLFAKEIAAQPQTLAEFAYLGYVARLPKKLPLVAQVSSECEDAENAGGKATRKSGGGSCPVSRLPAFGVFSQ